MTWAKLVNLESGNSFFYGTALARRRAWVAFTRPYQSVGWFLMNADFYAQIFTTRRRLFRLVDHHWLRRIGGLVCGRRPYRRVSRLKGRHVGWVSLRRCLTPRGYTASNGSVRLAKGWWRVRGGGSWWGRAAIVAVGERDVDVLEDQVVPVFSEQVLQHRAQLCECRPVQRFVLPARAHDCISV